MLCVALHAAETQPKLLASNGAANDRFGNAIAISGDTVIVGAPFSMTDQGSAYIFVRSGSGWIQEALLTPFDGANNDSFATSVAIDGDTAVVGSPRSGAHGGVYVYVRVSGVWTLQQKLTASDFANSARYGAAVSISADSIAVGSPGNSGSAGAVYLYARSAGAWTEESKVTAADPAANSNLGYAVAISGDTVVAGAPYPFVGTSIGSAYVFFRSTGVWSQQAKLTASDGAVNDEYGFSVGISADTVVVGAPLDDTPAANDHGSVYVYSRSAAIWTEQAHLMPIDGSDLYLGYSVGIDGDRLVAGSEWDRPNGFFDAGSIFLYTRSGTAWMLAKKFGASDDASTAARMGYASAISGTTVAGGAPFRAESGHASQGAAYIFEIASKPLATPDAYATPVNQPLVVAAPGLLSNDLNGVLTAANVSPPAQGSVTVNPDGSFLYTPNVGFSGIDTFTYQANDGVTDSAPATVQISVGSASIAVLEPHGGEHWRVGDAHVVRWTSAGVTNVSVELSRDNGATWTVLSAPVPASAGQVSWTVSGSAASNALIRITDADTGAVTAISPSSFSIENYYFVDTNAVMQGIVDGGAAVGDFNNDGLLDIAIVGADENGNGVAKVYRNNGDGTFTDMLAAITGLTRASLAWCDYDNDGKLDLLVSGRAVGQPYTTTLYHNTGAGFVDSGVALPGLIDSTVVWGDYNNDGRPDLFIAGRTQSPNGQSAQIFRNDGNGVFTDIHANLTGVLNCSAAWADYDNDGRLDLVVCGLDEAANVRYTKIYHNDGNDVFTDIGAPLVGVDRGHVDWGDFDNDGQLDLAVCGWDGTSYFARVYRNNNGVFTDIGAGLTGIYRGGAAWGDFDNTGAPDLILCGKNSASNGVSTIYRNTGGSFAARYEGTPATYNGSVQWGDFNNDGRLDLLFAGALENQYYAARVYRNEVPAVNTPPAAPTGLASTTSRGSATFSWTAASDAETPVAGLTYNLRVGSAPGKDDIVGAMSDLNSGRRRIVGLGNAQKNLSRTINALPPGTYYWSVQAIDTAFAGSPWAAEQIAVVTSHAPVANSQTLSTPFQTALNLTLTATDPDHNPLSYAVVAGPAHGTLTGTAPGLTYTPATGYAGADSFTFKTNDGTADSNVATIALTINAPVLSPPPPTLTLASTAAAAPNPSFSGVTIVFSVAAASTETLTYAWDFSDGATGSGSQTSHAYTVAGTYTAIVTVAAASGATLRSSVQIVIQPVQPHADSNQNGIDDADEIALGLNPADTAGPAFVAFSVTGLSGVVNFTAIGTGAGKDRCTVSGILPALPKGFAPNGAACSLFIGGVRFPFTLNAKGGGASAQGKILLALKTVKDKVTGKSLFPGGHVAFKAMLKNGAWSADFQNSGIAPGKIVKDQRLTMPVVVLFGGTFYKQTTALNYSCINSKSGKFKLAN